MDNYADLKQLERHIDNDVTPSRTTTDILANLKLLNETSILSKANTTRSGHPLLSRLNRLYTDFMKNKS